MQNEGNPSLGSDHWALVWHLTLKDLSLFFLSYPALHRQALLAGYLVELPPQTTPVSAVYKPQSFADEVIKQEGFYQQA